MPEEKDQEGASSGETPADETPADETPADETAAEKPKGPATRSPTNPLSRPTDAVARPGFRNPPNAKTKAQKKKKR